MESRTKRFSIFFFFLIQVSQHLRVICNTCFLIVNTNDVDIIWSQTFNFNFRSVPGSGCRYFFTTHKKRRHFTYLQNNSANMFPRYIQQFLANICYPSSFRLFRKLCPPLIGTQAVQRVLTWSVQAVLCVDLPLLETVVDDPEEFLLERKWIGCYYLYHCKIKVDPF